MSAIRIAPLLVSALLLGCGSTDVDPDPQPPKNDAGAPPRFDSATMAPDAAVDALPDAPVVTDVLPFSATCDEVPIPWPGARVPVRVDIELTYAGKPFEFGQPVALPAGTLTLTSLRFYLSELAFLRPNYQAVPVDVVGADGKPVPYGTHLATPEEAAGMTFQVAAPAGEYERLLFRFGLSPACDQMNPATSKPPLTFASQMDWPGPFGYLFLRYGARLESVPASEDLPTTIHMGGFPGMIFAPRAAAVGKVQVGASGGAIRLRVAIDQLLAAARMPATNEGLLPPPPPGGGIVEGDAVRQNLEKVSIFSLAPAP
jgi:hypothetical protein